MKKFKSAEPYPPPFEKQTKTLLEAGQAMMVRGGLLLSDGITLHTFTETNTLQVVVRAQECFYNSTNRSVSSAGPLQMQTADGKFSIEGVGFYWLQTNSSLFISNQVHTLIQPELLQGQGTNQAAPADNSDTGPLTILSDQFRYNGTNGLGVWSGHVRVNGTNLLLNSDVLTAQVPTEGQMPLDPRAPMKPQRLQSLLAQGNVAVDYTIASNRLHGTSARLTYAPDTGLVRLVDHATWTTADRREGSGDELIIDRSNQVFQVNGHAWLKLPGQSIGESGFLSFSNAPAQTLPGQRFIEIFSNRYEVRTNAADFYDQVRLLEHWNGTVRSRMSCQTMSASFAGTNQLQNIVAEQNVVIEEDDTPEHKQFNGGRAVYTHTNTTLEITRNPTWQAGTRSGKGELVRVNTQLSEMLVKGNASLHLPANELASQLSSTNPATANPPSTTSTNQFADIYCQEYTLQATNSVFRGGVYVSHPELNCTCERMTLCMPSPGLTNLVTEGNVVFDLLSQDGKMHGTGDTAIYSFGQPQTTTNGAQAINQVRLTGTPAFMTNFTRGIEAQDTILIWDRARDKVFGAGGHFKMQGSAPALATNTLLLPNHKQAK